MLLTENFEKMLISYFQNYPTVQTANFDLWKSPKDSKWSLALDLISHGTW